MRQQRVLTIAQTGRLPIAKALHAKSIHSRILRTGLPILASLLLVVTNTNTVYAGLSQNQVNAFKQGIYYFNTETCGSTSDTTDSLPGNDPTQKTFYYFTSKGLTPLIAAAVSGNLKEESGGTLDPTIIQNPPDGPGGRTQDPSWIAPPKWPKAGWGIAQWTPGAKAITVAQQLNIPGPVYNLSTQLNMVWAEMTGTSPTGATDMVKGLEAVTGNSQETQLQAAVEYFRVNFEGGSPAAARETYAQQILNQYGGSAVQGGGSGTTSCYGSGAGCAGGGGSGAFTDNTNATMKDITGRVITAADIQQVCQRAQQMSDPTTALFQDWCNRTKLINTPTAADGCHINACAFTAAFVWGYANSGYGTASDQWGDMQKRGVAHVGDRNPPVGALLFYDNHLDTGHVAVYLGHNTVVSSDIRSDGHYTGGRVGIVPAKDMEGSPFDVQYLGWSDPVYIGTKL